MSEHKPYIPTQTWNLIMRSAIALGLGTSLALLAYSGIIALAENLR